jgi:hypothetical protein
MSVIKEKISVIYQLSYEPLKYLQMVLKSEIIYDVRYKNPVRFWGGRARGKDGFWFSVFCFLFSVFGKKDSIPNDINNWT